MNSINLSIAVQNAGLILLQNYFIMLFERLNLVNERSFVSGKAQLDAVHYLQYIVTGLTETDESFLTLNKVLCGLPLSAPVKSTIIIPETHKELIEGMIQSSIGSWEAIGNSSVNGFRGNWLAREGVLREEEDRWNLSVEKRPYDILIAKFPFSFSTIKFPWMQKPLYVNWSF
ncbi:MAG: contractile injection system tape measure protein [Paludibacter sp.]|nr:contractile injection system tape measure protein [Paludibacter sp.]